MGHSGIRALRRPLVFALVSSLMLLGFGVRPAAALVSQVSGGAHGYRTFVGLFGGPPEQRGPANTTGCTGGATFACTPTLTLPSGGGNLTADDPDNDTDPDTNAFDGATAQYGPAILHRSTSERVTTQGTTGLNGSVSSSATLTFDQSIADGPVFADSISSTCTANESGQSGTATFVNATLQTSTDPESGEITGLIPLPANPAPNSEYYGTLDHIGDAFRLVLNEQVRTADAITVRAFHMYLLGEIAVGEYIVGESRCGVTGSTSNTAPVANNDAYSTAEDTPLTISAPGVLANDTDANGHPLTAAKPSGQPVPTNPAINCTGQGPCAEPIFFPTEPDNGKVIVNGNGSFTYTPNTDFTGVDTFTYIASDPRGGTDTAVVTITVNEQASAGTFTPLTPARILDTRDGTGACTPTPCAAVQGGSPIEVQVSGRGGVPASGVMAVVMNVTVTQPSATSFLTVWPSDATQPTVSNLNYSINQTVPNLITVKLSATGTVKIANFAGSTHVIADVAGWYEDDTKPPASRYNALTPARILDTRDGTGACTPSPCSAVQGGSPREVQVAGQGGVPSSGVTAVVMNVTVTQPSATSFLTVWPADATQPTVSNLNYSINQTVPNLVTVKLSANGTVKIANFTGSTHVIADVAGWYGAAGSLSGARFAALTPARILDTRDGTGTCTPSPCAAVQGGSPIDMLVAGRGGVPASGVTAVVMNVTVTQPSATSFLTVWPADATQPTVSNLNYSINQTVPNLVMVKLSATGRVKIANFTGSTHAIADVAGWFNDGAT